MRTLLLVLFALLAVPSFAEDAPQDTDPVSLAALMVQDGHWDRAEAVLAEVDLTDEDLDRARYYTLLGLVRQQSQDHAGSADAFGAALENGAEPLVAVYQAQALLRLERYRDALAALDRSGTVGDTLPAVWMLQARAWQGLDDPSRAWESLEDGLDRFPTHRDLSWQQVLLLIEMGLYQEARDRGTTLLAEGDAEPEEWLAIAESLRQAGQGEVAARTLEEANLRFPGHKDLMVQLARVHLEQDRPLAAGTLLQRAAELDDGLTIEAAECFRRAGSMDRALYMNSLAPDPVEKTRQRLGLLLEAQAYDRAASLEPRLERLGLLSDDQVRYGLAYALFRSGDYDGAEELLKGIVDPELFEHASKLRAAMEQCQDSAWGCE